MKNIITLDNLKYQYNETDLRPALDGVSFDIQEGEWIAIIGPNGSGKSTLAKTINGLIAPDSGEVIIDELKLSDETIWNVREKVGMVFQNPDNQFVGSTVQDDVAFGLENQGVPRDEMVRRVESALSQVRMLDYKEKEPARLSGGQKQRVAIAGVVAIAPKIMILDEATSMLDPKGRQEVIETVQQIKEKENLTVISITHDIDEAANANRIFVMQAGKMVKEGTPEEIFANGNRLVEMGLDLPFPERLKIALEERGLQVPETYLTEEGMVDWLWTLLSKK